MADATARDLGERALIARATARLPQGPDVIIGPGDDAAVLACGDRVVATCDAAVEGVHFRRDWSTGYDVGRRTAAANCADVMAMGGTATALLVAMVVAADLPVSWLDGLADGLRDEAALVGASVVGGDTVAGPVAVVAVTALGALAGPAVRRGGARPGDAVVVVGRLGGSAAGLRALLSGQRAGPSVRAHLRPEPPYPAGPALAALGATAMCDVSDGLVADLLDLCVPSGVGVELHPDRVPLGPGATLHDALHGGEDHALLATVPAALRTAARALGAVEVGRVVPGEPRVRTPGGRELVPEGFRHF